MTKLQADRDISFIAKDCDQATQTYKDAITEPTRAKQLDYGKHERLAAMAGFRDGWLLGALFMYDTMQEMQAKNVI